MESKTQAQLLAELNANIRSTGNGGKTTADDVRQILTSLIEELFNRTAAPTTDDTLAQATGQSTTLAMSQKAVTDALAIFVTNPTNLVHPNRTRDYYATAAAAIAQASAGDTLVLPAPVSDVTVIGNEAQLFLSSGLSVHTEGFDVGSLLTSGDAITLVGGSGKFVGNNSRVFSNSDGAWGMGAYGNAVPGMFYEVYDLHFANRTTTAVIFNSDCDVHFYNCHFNSSNGTAVWGRLNNPRLYFHNCLFRITGTSHAARLSAPVKMVFENCLIQTQDRTATDHLLGNAQVGEVHLINTTVLAETPATSAIKASRVVLQGNTSITGLIEAATIIDERPAATGPGQVADVIGSILEFVFEADTADAFVRTMGTYQAGEYRTNSLQNVATVAYTINNAASPATLPFTLIMGDTLEVRITRASMTQAATVILQS
ncbi:hypothetical protein [Hymenobacter rubripertinctus]|uniref:Right-handed parallel beta-helix repeat-containing protein n=1 Tax=Hymenobacter rubripertinctus TaxID=2029981 RepID=A0A418QKQ1_9BACT|nr:hypothetical protein [Hymenobacter rubripertinctus]RIY05807.1 hypothetical protein D0T11_19750 [Hymenobacter rubripertinctus]